MNEGNKDQNLTRRGGHPYGSHKMATLASFYLFIFPHRHRKLESPELLDTSQRSSNQQPTHVLPLGRKLPPVEVCVGPQPTARGLFHTRHRKGTAHKHQKKKKIQTKPPNNRDEGDRKQGRPTTVPNEARQTVYQRNATAKKVTRHVGRRKKKEARKGENNKASREER